MGQRITQRIFECSICEQIPEDGEHLWHMGSETWCKSCCDKSDEEEEEELKCYVCDKVVKEYAWQNIAKGMCSDECKEKYLINEGLI